MDPFYTFEGIGTHWRIGVTEELPDDAIDDVLASVIGIVREFEGNYSRFITSSLVGKLNTKGQVSSPPKEFVKMLEFALDCAETTNSFFNITVGARLEDIGYDNNYTLRKKDAFRQIPQLKDVLSITENEVLLSDQASIDFGGFGKGWLIDRIARHLKARGINDFIIDGGGDILVGGRPYGDKSIPLEDPWNQKKTIGEIPVHSSAIASSSPKYRNWPDITTGQTMHHLINPSSELAITDVAAVYTHAENATSADTASTALFVSPSDLHARIASHFKASYCIVYSDGSFYQTSDYPGTIFSKS